jgi:hypothetical protein
MARRRPPHSSLAASKVAVVTTLSRYYVFTETGARHGADSGDRGRASPVGRVLGAKGLVRGPEGPHRYPSTS